MSTRPVDLRAYNDPTYEVTHCKACEGDYRPTTLEQKYCSRLCKRRAAAWRYGYTYFTYNGVMYSTASGELLYSNTDYDESYCEQCNDYH